MDWYIVMSREEKIFKANFILNIIFTVALIPVWYFILSATDVFDDFRVIFFIIGYAHIFPSIVSMICHYKAYWSKSKFAFGGMAAHLLMFSITGFIFYSAIVGKGESPEWLIENKSIQILFIVVVITQVVIPFAFLCVADGVKNAGYFIKNFAVSISVFVIGAILSLVLLNSGVFDNSFVVMNGVPVVGQIYAFAPLLAAVIVVAIMWERA